MAAKLKRVSQAAEAAIATIAEREGRSFVAQLDRIVAAGLDAMGEPVPAEIAPEPAAKAPRKAASKARN